MARGDIRLEIIYNLGDPIEILIRTNAKKEAVPNILENWILSQIGQGEDQCKAKTEDIYRIIIELDLNGDIFHTTSNTGNAGLTAGIILDIFENRMNETKIVNF